MLDVISFMGNFNLNVRGHLQSSLLPHVVKFIVPNDIMYKKLLLCYVCHLSHLSKYTDLTPVDQIFHHNSFQLSIPREKYLAFAMNTFLE